ncbi:MAG: HEAT repeat domain-containing protein [Planctomycetes bacterium]|jgi:HEAT repeat protein|nr:HEAT repeat domain-containing protein [Planctomycetota bacterium]
MLRIGYTGLVVFAAALAFAVIPAAIVQAQGADAQAQTAGKTPEDLWKDMLNYINVARPELAASYGQALLSSTATPEQVFEFQRTTPGSLNDIERAMKSAVFRPIGQQVLAVIGKGYIGRKSDPKVIAEALDSLMGGTLKGYELSSARLVESGEFCMPQLMQKLASQQVSEQQKDRIIAFLPNLKLDAVRPLCEALRTEDLVLLERVAVVLGQIGYPHAAPALREALDRQDLLPRTRQAIEAALLSVAGRSTPSVSNLYYDLAEKYYYRAESLQSNPAGDVGNVWFWKQGLGLTFSPVPRDIFCDVYAMRCARLALKADPKNASAVSLWLAANIRRQASLPKGSADPIMGETAMPAEFYSLASSAGYLQDVLARGLKDNDLAVITAAIDALGKTAGAANLVRPTAGGKQPLVEAMAYSNGRIRFFAAITLAQALPTQRFGGQEGVIPVLNDAINLSIRNKVMVTGDDDTLVNKVKGIVRAGGWQLVEGSLADATNADAVVFARKKDAGESLTAIRRLPSAATVILLADEGDDVRRLAERTGVVLLAAGSADDIIKTAIQDAFSSAATPGMTEQEAGDWAVQAANAIEMLASSKNTVFDLKATVGPLTSRLGDQREAVRLAAAAALGAMEIAEAQQAVAGLGLDAQAPNAIRVAALNYASESTRRFSNMLTESQQQAVLDVVMKPGDTDVRQAAARLLGILNLPSEKIKDLILQAGAVD